MNDMQSALDALRPKLVGQDWSAYEGCSLLGVVIRMARLNHMQSGDIRTCFGLTIRRKSDILGKLLRSGDQHRMVAQMQAFSGVFVKDWKLENWWPYGSEPVWESLTHKMRQCPVCALYGYHSALFQLPGLAICPWHRVRLLDGCHRCGKPLLDGFNQGLRLLQCTCGHDHFSFTRAIAGDESTTSCRQQRLGEYRSWSRHGKRTRWLFNPGQWDPRGPAALEILTCPPWADLVFHDDLVVDSVVAERTALRSDALIAHNSGLEQARATVAKLPRSWLGALESVSRRAVQMPGLGCLSDKELRAFGAERPAGPAGPAAGAAEGIRLGVFRLKPSRAGGDAYLHTEVLGGVTLMALGGLADGIGRQPVPRSDSAERREFRRWVTQHQAGHQLVSGVVFRVLTRSYADGCRILLGQIDPDLYRARLTRPVRRFPWIALSLGENGQARGTIVWTRQTDQ